MSLNEIFLKYLVSSNLEERIGNTEQLIKIMEERLGIFN